MSVVRTMNGTSSDDTEQMKQADTVSSGDNEDDNVTENAIISLDEDAVTRLLTYEASDCADELARYSATRAEWVPPILKERYADSTFFNVQFCKDTQLSVSKSACFVMAMDTCFRTAVDDAFVDPRKAFEAFKRIVLEYCARAKDDSECFSDLEMKRASTFAAETFTRNYSLFRCIYDRANGA